MNSTSTPRTDATSASTTEPAGVKPRYSVDGDRAACAIRIEMPGVKKDGVSVRLDNEVLTIHGRRTSSAPAAWKPLHRELSEDDFVLRLKLNGPVDETKLSAKLDLGLLTVTLPVKEAAKPRTIAVS